MTMPIVNCRVQVATAAMFLICATAYAAGPAPLVDAAKAGNVAAVRSELQKKADVNAPAVDGSTALHWAVHNNALDSVDLLLGAGANVMAANRYGVTPLTLAATNGHA